MYNEKSFRVELCRGGHPRHRLRECVNVPPSDAVYRKNPNIASPSEYIVHCREKGGEIIYIQCTVLPIVDTQYTEVKTLKLILVSL